MKLNKSRLNIWIDTLLFILLMAMAGIGFLIKYVLLAGYRRNEVYGNDVDLSFLGFDRHQWGTTHLVISLVFIFFLALHLILHVAQIKCMVRK